MEHPGRALDRSLFSSAAQRALRPRPAAAAANPLSSDVGGTLPLAAAAPPPPDRSPPRALHTDAFARAAGRRPLDDVVHGAAPDMTRLRDATTLCVPRIASTALI